LVDVLEQGRSAGKLCFSGDPVEVARLLVSSLEGAMLVARTFGDTERFRSIAARLLYDLSPLASGQNESGRPSQKYPDPA
jgi:hypothetical protein